MKRSTHQSVITNDRWIFGGWTQRISAAYLNTGSSHPCSTTSISSPHNTTSIAPGTSSIPSAPGTRRMSSPPSPIFSTQPNATVSQESF